MVAGIDTIVIVFHNVVFGYGCGAFANEDVVNAVVLFGLAPVVIRITASCANGGNFLRIVKAFFGRLNGFAVFQRIHISHQKGGATVKLGDFIQNHLNAFDAGLFALVVEVCVKYDKFLAGVEFFEAGKRKRKREIVRTPPTARCNRCRRGRL